MIDPHLLFWTTFRTAMFWILVYLFHLTLRDLLSKNSVAIMAAFAMATVIFQVGSMIVDTVLGKIFNLRALTVQD